MAEETNRLLKPKKNIDMDCDTGGRRGAAGCPASVIRLGNKGPATQIISSRNSGVFKSCEIRKSSSLKW